MMMCDSKNTTGRSDICDAGRHADSDTNSPSRRLVPTRSRPVVGWRYGTQVHLTPPADI